MRDGGVLRVLGRGDGVETLGQLGELVTVRHPNLHGGVLKAGKQTVGVGVDALGLELGRAILAVDTGNNVVLVQTVGQLLLAVADTENWDVEVKVGRVDVGSVGVVNGVGAATENEADGLELELGQLGGAGLHLRVDVELAQTTDDPLGRRMPVSHCRMAV